MCSQIKKVCLREIVRDGSCKDRGVYFCYDEFNAIGSWTMAKDCECQQLPQNKRRCQCCVNCDYKAKLLSDTFHIRQINDTHDRCSNL